MAKFADMYYLEPQTGSYKILDDIIPITINGDYGYGKCILIAHNKKKITGFNISATLGTHEIFVSTKDEDPTYWHTYTGSYRFFPTPVVYLWIRIPKLDNFAETNTNLSTKSYTITPTIIDDEIENYGAYNLTNASTLTVTSNTVTNPVLIDDNDVYIDNGGRILKSSNHGSMFSGYPNGRGLNTVGVGSAVRFFYKYDGLISFGQIVSNVGKINSINPGLNGEANVLSHNNVWPVDAVIVTKDGVDYTVAMVYSRTVSFTKYGGCYKSIAGANSLTKKKADDWITYNSRIFKISDTGHLRGFSSLTTSRSYYNSTDYGDNWTYIYARRTPTDAVVLNADNFNYICGNTSIHNIDASEVDTNILGIPNATFRRIAYGYDMVVAYSLDQYAASPTPYLYVQKEGSWYRIPLLEIAAFPWLVSNVASSLNPKSMFFTNDRSLLLIIDGFFIKLPIDKLFDISGTIKLVQDPYIFNNNNYFTSSANIDLPSTNTQAFEFEVRMKIDSSQTANIIKCGSGNFAPTLSIAPTGILTASFGGVTMVHTTAISAGKWYEVKFGYSSGNGYVRFDETIKYTSAATYDNTGNTTISVAGPTNLMLGSIDYVKYSVNNVLKSLWDFNKPYTFRTGTIQIKDYTGRKHITKQ